MKRGTYEITGNKEVSNSQSTSKKTSQCVLMAYQPQVAWDPDSRSLGTAVSFLRSAQSCHAQWTQCSLANPNRHSQIEGFTGSQSELHLFSVIALQRPPPQHDRSQHSSLCAGFISVLYAVQSCSCSSERNSECMCVCCQIMYSNSLCKYGKFSITLKSYCFHILR